MLPQALGLVPVISLLAPVVYLPMLWRADQRGLHDMLAGTVVIKGGHRAADPGAVAPMSIVIVL